MNPSVVVIGAGISGLVTALTLKKRGIDVVLLGSASQAGGAVHTIRKNGYLCEYGPNTLMLSNSEAIQFLEKNHLLKSALDAAPNAQKRFVVQNGELIPIPTSAPAFLRSNLLSWKSKFQILTEPFYLRGKDENETIAHFVRRRLGKELLHELIGPFISGIYAGDPEKLILRHTLPKLHAIEQTYGSLIYGAIRMRRGAIPKGRLISWPGGLSEMISGLTTQLGDQLQFNTPVQQLQKESDQWVVRFENSAIKAKNVVIATDATSAAHLLSTISLNSPNTALLQKIPHAPMAVIHLGFPRSSVKHPLDGFGVLISRKRGIRTLGALFSSTLFPGRAPVNHVLITAFIGGTLDPDILNLDDATLIQTVQNDLSPLLKITSSPVFENVVRWRRAIPQYEHDHSRVIDLCQKLESSYPGIHLIGNYRDGISLESRLIKGHALGNSISIT